MASLQPAERPPRTGGNIFATTHWSVVLAAGRGSSPESADALERLCRAYWYPLYAYVRRRGFNPHDAQDLTQEFFARFVERNYLTGVDREKGKFRSFLLASMNHFLANERDKANAQKRGGRQTFISWDNESAEKRYREEPLGATSPESIFEQRWALAVLNQALGRLRDEFRAADKADQFELLKVFLEGETQPGDYTGLAAQLEMTAGAAAVAVHRLRLRYRELVRSEIAETVACRADVEDEMRHLFKVIGG